MFAAAAIALGIVTVLVSGNRGARPGGPAASNPAAALRGAIEPTPAAPGVVERRASGPSTIEPGAIEPGAVEPGAVETDAPPAQGTAGARTGRDGERARALIAAMRGEGAEEDLDTVFREAGESLEEGRPMDAHLLYLFAARRGHAPAAFVLGGLYDPQLFDKDKSLLGKPDVAQALKWYRVAAGEGHGEAQARLKALESRVDAEARAEDAEAERLRLSWH
jgi:TPR repeat protein